MSDETVQQPQSAGGGEPSPGGQESEGLPSTALVEVEGGLAILFGDHVPEGVDVIPFTFLDSATLAAVSTAAGAAVGLGSVAAQGVNATMQAQGLVRLAPHTLAALKTATPVVKDGWNLGTLASGGKYAAQVRWLPATAATTASVVAAMGAALSLMVIQVQLDQIANIAKHNLELTSKVLEVVRRDQWSSVTGHYKTLMTEFDHARQINAVTDAIYKEVRGYAGELKSQWEDFHAAVQQHVESLRSKRGHQERQKYLLDNGQAIIADAQALLLAQTSWFVHQAMRAANVSRSASSNPEDELLLKALIADVQDHEIALDETNWILDQLAREFAIIGELSGKKTFKIGGSARAARDAQQMVRQLQQALASVRGQDVPKEPQPLTPPSILVFEEQVPPELLRILPLRLELDERVLALADASCDRSKFLGGGGWVAITDRRLLITKQESLRQVGGIDIDIRAQDIRYVRQHYPADKAPIVDVITKRENLTLHFPPWAKSDPARQDARRMGRLLASYMNLPKSEVPTIHLSELATTTGPEAE